ncbi:hypothetical protein ACA910_012850 [Epithemia clementina (nom. ined.)]
MTDKKRKHCFLDEQLLVEPSLDFTAGSRNGYFLPFHLQVLRSLYNKEHDEGGDDTNCSNNDLVSRQMWEAFEEFLRNRADLILFKNKALKCRGIQDQAFRFVKTNEPQNPFISTEAAAAKATNTPSSTTKQRGTPRSALSTSSAGDRSPEVMKAPKQNTLILFARLLEKRATKVDSAFQEQVAKPYAPLLQLTRQMVEKLEKVKQIHADSLLEQNQKISKELIAINMYASSRSSGSASDIARKIQQERKRSDKERSKLVATECKIKLWRMLEQDLKLLL